MTPDKFARLIAHTELLPRGADRSEQREVLRIAGFPLAPGDSFLPAVLADRINTYCKELLELAIRNSHKAAFREDASDRDLIHRLVQTKQNPHLSASDRRMLARHIERLEATIAMLSHDNGYQEGYAAGLAAGRQRCIDAASRATWASTCFASIIRDCQPRCAVLAAITETSDEP